MTRPSSLCWEGVSLGWREVVPQTRSRGGEARRPHTPTDSIVHSAKLDSGLNSLEYWDYSVELECLSGPEDLQLAAELGKTLLERNKELENSLKHQQAVIDDQAQEIEYLNKQTTALREVNDSRLKIYEQLEINISDMEKSNSCLLEESTTDKARIKCLSVAKDQLEGRCEELQRAVEEARGQEKTRRRKERRKSLPKEQGKGERKASTQEGDQGGRGCTEREEKGGERDVMDEAEEEEEKHQHLESGYSSTESSSPHIWSEEKGEEEERGEIHNQMCWDYLISQEPVEGEVTLAEEEVARLSGELEWLRQETRHGDRKVEELEDQVAVLVGENRILNQSLEQERGRGGRVHRASTVEEEVLALNPASEGSICRRCLGHPEPSSPQDLLVLGASQLLDTAGSSILAWAKLEPKQGAGGQEQAGIDEEGKGGTESKADGKGPKLEIENWMGLEDTENNCEGTTGTGEGAPASKENTGKNEVSVNDHDHGARESPRFSSQLSLREELQMSSNFSHHSEQTQDQEEEEHIEQDLPDPPPCLLLPHRAEYRGQSTACTEYSEPETFSSGFSEDYRPSHRHTQTDMQNSGLTISSAAELEQHFQTEPGYREIFRQIFQVLKEAGPAGSPQDNHSPLPAPMAEQEVCSIVQEMSLPYIVQCRENFPSLAPADLGRPCCLDESYAAVLRRGTCHT